MSWASSLSVVRSLAFIVRDNIMTSYFNTDTIGRVVIAWFNDRILGKSGQISNPIIAMVDPLPYYMRTFMFAYLLITNTGNTRNSQLIDTRN